VNGVGERQSWLAWQQFRSSYAIYEDLRSYLPVAEAVASVRDQVADRKKKAADKPEALAALEALNQKLEPLGGSGPPTLPGVPRTAPLTFATITGRLGQLFGVLQEVDAAPTAQTVANINELRGLLPPLIAKWKSVTATDLPALNEKLRKAGLAEIKPETTSSGVIGIDVHVRAGQVAGEE